METKRPFTSFTWVIRDADNHRIGQIDNEERARLIVTACNHFEEAVGVCKSALRALEDNLHPGPMDEDAKVAIRALLAKIKEG